MTLDMRPVFHGDGEMVDHARAFAWEGTPLGPPSGWTPVLEALVGATLAAAGPVVLAWGPDATMVYNDACRALLGARHPGAFGSKLAEVWSDAGDGLAPLVDGVLAGRAVQADDIGLTVDRGRAETEVHVAVSSMPVRDVDGRVAGSLVSFTDTTGRMRSQRRQAFRLALEDRLRDLAETPEILAAAARALLAETRSAGVGFLRFGADGSARPAADFAGIGFVPPDPSASGASGRDWAARQRRGETLAVGDVDAEEALDAGAWRAAGIRAFVSVPLLRDGQLRASLLVVADAPRAWPRADVELLEAIAGRVWDRAERARADAALRSREARFSTIAQALPNQVWTATPGGAVDWVNARVHDYVGGDDSTLGRRGWAAVVHPDDMSMVATAWAASVATGIVYEAEFRIRRADGVHRWHLGRAVPLRDGEGRVTGWVGTNTDIDEQKAAEMEVVAARDQAEDANLAKSDFLANMSHELRTPLSAIIGYSELLREEMQDGTDATSLVPDMDKVEVNARHLLGLINDVLDLSKVESGKMDVYAEDFDVAGVVEDLAATVKALVDKKGNRLDLRLAPALGTMHSDLTKVRQVLLNLLSNAAKFTEAGTVTLSVRRHADDGGRDSVTFVVSDTGIGMTEEQLAKAFQRFSQADASTTRRFGGTGLGLSLTRAFADMLDGTVAVESVHGQGTTFSFTVPASHAAPAAAETLSEAPEPPDDDPAKDLVLVIDDDADQRVLMTRFLRREGFRVRVAVDGSEGLALARSLRPRAILLDVMMPGIDGWSVLSEIKADPDLSAIPVVMATSVEQKGLAESLGAADFMLKPVRWDRFSQIMGRFRKPDGHILLVEDSEEARVSVRTMLMEDGWEVTEAENGRDGLQRVLERRPDAVLMDLNMPVMDGFDFLTELRTLPGCSDIPVVVLTARELTRDDRAMLRGASQILNKGDVSLGELVERLHHLSADPPKGAPDRTET
jgi:PAS domain S-box-containing protein